MKEIQKETSIEDVERLMDDTADAIAYQEVRIITRNESVAYKYYIGTRFIITRWFEPRR